VPFSFSVTRHHSLKMATPLKVFVRIRPTPGTTEQKQGSDDFNDGVPAFKFDADANSFELKEKLYHIEGILPPPSHQTDVYRRVGTSPVTALLEGFNTTVFAYGQTGSGKTHTIFGADGSFPSMRSSPTKPKLDTDRNIIRTNSEIDAHPSLSSLFGLVPRCFVAVFERLRASNCIKKYLVELSCVEVYNTTLRDLFKPSNSQNLKIREDIKSKKFFVENLTEESIQSCEELLLFIRRIQLNRAVASTNMNHASSRSHVLLQLKVIQHLLTGETKESLLTFVDLAGSEMVKKTGTKGDQLKEAGYINSSLSTLSRVIEGLGLQHSATSTRRKSIKHQHIPFRDSSLTKLLKTALGGNCKTTLVVCVSASHAHREETNSSLRFATRAACIKNAPVINKALDAQALYTENIRLKAEIERMQSLENVESKQWLRDKLRELEQREQEVTELKVRNEELQIKMEQAAARDGTAEEHIAKIESENVAMNEMLNQLEVELMREKHAKISIEDKLTDLQILHSEAASQRLFDDESELLATEQMVSEYVKVELTNLPDVDETQINASQIVNELHDSSEEDVDDRESALHEALAMATQNQCFADALMKHLPTEASTDGTAECAEPQRNELLRNINSVQLLRVSESMNEKIEALEARLAHIERESEKKKKVETPEKHEFKRWTIQSILSLNVTDVSFINGHAVSSYGTKTTESAATEYNAVQSLIESNESTLKLKQISQATVQSPFRVYKNDSGTEISFEPFSDRRSDHTEEPDEQAIDSGDVQVQIDSGDNGPDSEEKEKEKKDVEMDEVEKGTQTEMVIDVEEVGVVGEAEAKCSFASIFSCVSS